MDVLVMMEEPTFPGCVIEARPLGMLRLKYRGQSDDKILAVPSTDPQYADYDDIGDLPKHFPKAVEHFFITYKHWQDAIVESEGWVGVKEAKEAILGASKHYLDSFPPQRI